MGSGASAAQLEAVTKASETDIRAVLDQLSGARRAKLQIVLDDLNLLAANATSSTQKKTDGSGTSQHVDVDFEEPSQADLPIGPWDDPKYNCTPLKYAMLDTVLVDATWLADLADKNGILPRCQDVPEEARVTLADIEFTDPEVLRRNDYHAAIPVVVISYPWLTASHPDPLGEQLRTVSAHLRRFASLSWITDYGGKNPTKCRVGVFWDYCSLPQRSQRCPPGEDDRTPEDQQRFKRALKGINTWYAHPLTNVLLVSTPLPTGGDYTNLQPYDDRGWCVAERAMSSFVKHSGNLIDLSKDNRRPMPEIPPAFEARLRAGVDEGTIQFTNKGDVGLVAKIYERAFVAEFGNAIELDFSGNKIGDTGMHALAAALRDGAAPNLEKMDLESCRSSAQRSNPGDTRIIRAVRPELDTSYDDDSG